MAFPAPVASQAVPDVTITGTPTAVDLVDGLSAGELLLLWIWVPAGANVSIIPDGGNPPWTDIVGATGNAGAQMWGKFATGSETSASCVTHNSTSKQVWFYSERFGTSTHTSTLPAGASNPGSHDPLSLNPAGWDVEDTLWRVIGCENNSYTATPSGYSVVYNPGGAIYLLTKENNVASEDPGAFTGLGDSSVGTVAIRPAPPSSGRPGGMRLTRSTQRWR